ncbi:23S rRNA (uracil(1939)-C(5))-methyltransferase RlmD [Mycoplasmopsis opalescens]|uniref:23S rRNA (uracil(1939)-C(5))-methyltransferase RlmD n=1 Tax=Mycoplasmopsis opalescens TaxID=114886 RepID=UPI0004A7219A|nr:23S rRNA (uracil(1939)-C(5))-methyltransferase RlmD [Mycoplasmopsis opalescens]
MNFDEGMIINNQKAIDLSYEGLGVVQKDNYKIFVVNLLPEEEADIQIIKANSQFALAKVIKYHNYVQNRVKENDVLLNNGQAPLANLSYADQLAFKQKIVEELFARNLSYNTINPIIGSEKQKYYRNKVQLFFTVSNELIKLGVVSLNSHDVKEIDDYYLAHPNINNLLKFLQTNINNYESFVSNKHNLISVTIRHSDVNNNLFLHFEIKKMFKVEQDFIEAIEQAFPDLVMLKVSVKGQKNALYDHNFILKKSFLCSKYRNLYFNYGLESFNQINHQQANKILNFINDNIECATTKTLVDAYCGMGVIGLTLSSKFKKVYGIELSQEAIMYAKENAKISCLRNATFYVGDVDRVILKHDIDFDYIVLDPPRAGLSDRFLKFVLSKKPEKIIYLSCNVRTLVRDLQKITENNYRIDFVQPFDMFPQTHHVETLVVLSKIKE